jgi:hypothetical protein
VRWRPSLRGTGTPTAGPDSAPERDAPIGDSESQNSPPRGPPAAGPPTTRPWPARVSRSAVLPSADGTRRPYRLAWPLGPSPGSTTSPGARPVRISLGARVAWSRPSVEGASVLPSGPRAALTCTTSATRRTPPWRHRTHTVAWPDDPSRGSGETLTVRTSPSASLPQPCPRLRPLAHEERGGRDDEPPHEHHVPEDVEAQVGARPARELPRPGGCVPRWERRRVDGGAHPTAGAPTRGAAW